MFPYGRRITSFLNDLKILVMLEFITDRQIYERVICELIGKARKLVWQGFYKIL